MNQEDTYCDGVLIGKIGLNGQNMWVGTDLDGKEIISAHQRPDAYRALRSDALKRGLLERVRKGVYRAVKGS